MMFYDTMQQEVAMHVLACGDITTGTSLPGSAKSSLYKTELCKRWNEMGSCRYGDKCQFAHGEEDIRGILRHPKYKTAICKNFSITGMCRYGARCRFVHELGSPKLPGSSPNKTKVNDKYKTEMCKTWLKSGNCPYGPRCTFLHGAADPQALRFRNNLVLTSSQASTCSSSPLSSPLRRESWDLSSVDWTVASTGLPSSEPLSPSSLGCSWDSPPAKPLSSSGAHFPSLNVSEDLPLNKLNFDSPGIEISETEMNENHATIEWNSTAPNSVFKADHETEICTICFSKGADSRIVECGHEFHGYCALIWLRKSNTCPICRAPADDIEPVKRAKTRSSRGIGHSLPHHYDIWQVNFSNSFEI